MLPFMFNKSSRINTSDGFVIPFCAFLLTVFFIMASFVIDIGNARYQLRNIQVVADASSMAALVPLANAASPKYSAVYAEVVDIAARNGSSAAEITNVSCGVWNAGVFTYRGTNCDQSDTNAVQVSVSRQVNTFFGRFLNHTSITPIASAVSSSKLIKCIRPFVIKDTILNGIAIGGEFTIDNDNQITKGNWGPLNIGGGFTASSMISNSCDDIVDIGSLVPLDPGSDHIGISFKNALKDNPDGMIIALSSSEFQGSQNVIISEFITVNLTATSGKNGNNFSATFELVARNIMPPSYLDSNNRKLVK